MTARKSFTQLQPDNLTDAQRHAVRMLIDAVVEMGAYIDTPVLEMDPHGMEIWRRGAAALRVAKEAGL